MTLDVTTPHAHQRNCDDTVWPVLSPRLTVARWRHSDNCDTPHQFHIVATQDLDALADFVGVPALEWLWSGFNSFIMSYGQMNTGKTRAMFSGPEVCTMPNKSHCSDTSVLQGGLCTSMINGLFARIQGSSEPQTYMVRCAA